MTGQGMARVLTVHGLKRLRNSANGNPRQLVTFTDGTVAETAPDAQIGGLIENPEYRDVPLSVTFNPQGKIAKAQPLT